MPPMVMQHISDPAEDLRKKIGDLSDIEVTYSSVLLGIYFHPTVTAGGIHIAPITIDEDKHQGKVCLVLKKGPLAFKDTDTVSFNGFSVEVGDWVVIRTSDGWAINVRNTDCRMVSDTGIRMVIKNPDDVW